MELRENNAVEVVQRNLIMVRNSLGEFAGLRRNIFNIKVIKNQLKLQSKNGMSIKTLIEFCEMMDVDLQEMFYIDSDWEFNNDGTFKDHWEYNDKTHSRQFAPYNHRAGVYHDNLAINIRRSIETMLENGVIESKVGIRAVLGNAFLTEINKPFPKASFSVRKLGALNEELGLGLDDIVFYWANYEGEK